MRLTSRKIIAVLRQHGYKLTPQRRQVIEEIASQDHLTPAAIYEKVRQRDHNIGLVTIYRTLKILSELGLICELHAGGSCHSYTIGSSGHHHHLVCSNCGTVVDFTGYDLGELERRLSKETGFEVEDHLLEFVGVCQDCQKRASA